MAGKVGSAVVSEITSRAVSKIIGLVNKQGSVSENLRKLETLCAKINGAVAASEDRITGTYLLKWQEKLREAGTEGDDVLFGFRWRALNEASKSSNHQIWTLDSMTYTKVAVSNVVSYFHNAVKMLLSSNEDVQKLNITVKKLEKLSADNDEFSTLVELEVLMREEQAPVEGEKPEILGKLSTEHEELSKLVELEILTGEEHAPAKGKKPEMWGKLSADNQEISKLVELEVLTGEEHAPAKGKKPVVICGHSLSQKEVHQHSNRTRAVDSILQSNEMVRTVKRAAPVRWFSSWIV